MIIYLYFHKRNINFKMNFFHFISLFLLHVLYKKIVIKKNHKSSPTQIIYSSISYAI